MHISTIVTKIKQYGPNNAQVIADMNNKYKIVINTPQGMVTLKDNLDKNIAEDIIRQATSRVLLG